MNDLLQEVITLLPIVPCATFLYPLGQLLCAGGQFVPHIGL